MGFVLRRPMLSRCPRIVGEVPERSIGAVSKTVVPLAGTEGSNPSLSANRYKPRDSNGLLFYRSTRMTNALTNV
jgi:hypothetical protein